MTDVNTSKNEVQDLFNDLAPVVLDVVDKYTAEADKLIEKVKNAGSYTNSELRDLILQLSIESYMFGQSKDASLLKQECAITLLKQQQAELYNSAEGTQAIRQNSALIGSADKQVVNMIYNSVASMMKTKHDELHRIINTLNSILISRNAEAKLAVGNPMLDDRTSQLLLE